MIGGRAFAAAALAAAAVLLAACGGQRGPDFTILAGSENAALEPIVQRFCREHRLRCEMRFAGSLDIGQSLRPDQPATADAVWPASGAWIDLYDSGRRVQGAQSIYQSPVILGVRLARARELGWVGRPVRMAEIVQAVREGRLTFMMASATQSNSGASAYLSMISSALGAADRLTAQQAADPRVVEFNQSLGRAVVRSAASSGRLAELYQRTAIEGRPYDAMWNYEALLRDVNVELRQRGLEPLYAIYPVEGSAVADAPLGYLSHGQPERTQETFRQLQAYLLSRPVQAEIARMGRRIPLGRAAPGAADPSWNFDPRRLVTALTLPEPGVLQTALTLYQRSVQRPSLTAICYDISGTLEERDQRRMAAVIGSLFSPDASRQTFMSLSARDRVLLIPFNRQPADPIEASGDPSELSRIVEGVRALSPGGGSNMYTCGQRALDAIHTRLGAGGNQVPAVVMMTNGRSDDGMTQFMDSWRAEGHRVPVISVVFGRADRAPLDALARETGGAVFDGNTAMAEAFRAARGYN